MGWLFCAETKSNLIESLLADIPKNRYIRHSVRGNNLWVLMREVDGTEKFIVLFRMQGTRDSNPMWRWGYKDMTEACGPYYYDCPVSMLRESTYSDPRAVEWRKHALKYHEDKKANKSAWGDIHKGDSVIAGDRVVVVTDPDYKVTSVFTGRNRTPGQFLGYVEGDPDRKVFRFRKSKFTPVAKGAAP